MNSTLHDTGGFISVIKLRISKCEITLEYLGGPNVNIRVPIEGGRGPDSAVDVMTEMRLEQGKVGPCGR